MITNSTNINTASNMASIYIINHKEQHNIWQGKTSYCPLPPPLSLSPMWKQDTTLIACRNIIYDHINKNNKLYETKWSRKPIIFSTVSVYPLAKNCLDSSAFLFKKTFKVVPYTSGKIWSACLIFLFFWQCVWIYPL